MKCAESGWTSCWGLVLQFSDAEEIAAFAQTHKLAKQIIEQNNKVIWKNLCQSIDSYDPISAQIRPLQVTDLVNPKAWYTNLLHKYKKWIGYWWQGTWTSDRAPEIVRKVLGMTRITRGIKGENQCDRGKLIEVRAEGYDKIVGYQLFVVAVQGKRNRGFEIVREKLFEIDFVSIKWRSFGITKEDLMLNGIVAQISEEWMQDCDLEISCFQDTENGTLCLSRNMKSKRWLVDEKFSSEYSLHEFLSKVLNFPHHYNLSPESISQSMQNVFEHAHFHFFTSVINYVQKCGGSINESGEVVFFEDRKEGEESNISEEKFKERLHFFKLPISQFIATDSSLNWEFDLDLLCGLWVGDYNAHGFEFLWFSATENSGEYCSFVKLTGDPNVPAGTISILLKKADLRYWNMDAPAFIQVSEQNYARPQLDSGFFRAISPTEIRFLWSTFGLVSVFYKIAN